MEILRKVNNSSNLVFRLDDGLYCIGYIYLDKVHRVKTVEEKIDGCFSLPGDKPYIIGLWQQPITRRILVLYDLRVWLGFEPRPYHDKVLIFSLCGAGIEKYGLIVDGQIQQSSQGKDLDTLIIKLSPDEIISGRPNPDFIFK